MRDQGDFDITDYKAIIWERKREYGYQGRGHEDDWMRNREYTKKDEHIEKHEMNCFH